MSAAGRLSRAARPARPRGRPAPLAARPAAGRTGARDGSHCQGAACAGRAAPLAEKDVRRGLCCLLCKVGCEHTYDTSHCCRSTHSKVEVCVGAEHKATPAHAPSDKAKGLVAWHQDLDLQLSAVQVLEADDTPVVVRVLDGDNHPLVRLFRCPQHIVAINTRCIACCTRIRAPPPSPSSRC